MIRFIALFLLLLISTVHAGQGAEYVNGYFELWLKAHNFKDFEKRTDGIFFSKNGVILDGEIHEVKELQPGKFYSVESRISVRLKNGRRIDDFVAGAGSNAQEAFYDSLQNFCLTTLHPIYAELFDHKDPHVRKVAWNVNGIQRRIFLSEWGMRGKKIDEVTQRKVEQILADELKAIDVSPEIHWVKLVVAGKGNKLNTLVVTIDGVQHEKITQRLAAYRWPESNDFFMGKLFFVVGRA
jgi:hypothetical protein